MFPCCTNLIPNTIRFKNMLALPILSLLPSMEKDHIIIWLDSKKIK